MKVTCICFGGYKELLVRSSPFIKDDNIVDSLPSRSSIEVEHCIYNDNWFKIKNQDAYIVMWLRTNIGLIDYQLDRASLKMFAKKTIVDDDITERINKITIRQESEMVVNKITTEQAMEIDVVLPKRITKTKKERIPATVRNIVWVTHFHASKKGQCWLCKVEDISSANFECGHVVSEKNGGKPTIDNLRPICGFCNKSVGTMNMEDFKKRYNIP